MPPASHPWLSQMAAVARLGDLWVAPMYLRGFPSPGSVGKNAPGEERLRRRRRFFKTSPSRNWDAATLDESDGATCWGRLGGSLLGLGFWVWVVRGSFYSLRSCLIFRRPRPTIRFFVENRMAKK